MSDAAQSVEIHPTNTCFDDASRIMVTLAMEGKSPVLVHGICGPAGKMPYSHAWVLEGGQAWQMGIVNGEKCMYGVPSGDFYGNWKVLEETRYPLEKYFLLHISHDNPGPWERRYLELCRDYEP